jgi:hypothetical protein
MQPNTKRRKPHSNKEDLHNILPDLSSHIHNTPITWTNHQLQSLSTKHLHTSRVLGTNILHIAQPYATPWHTTSPLESTLNATLSDPTAFLRNANTWIPLSTNPTHTLNHIHLAFEAITSSTHPTRICILTGPTHTPQPNNSCIRLHQLITIKRNSIQMHQDTQTHLHCLNQTPLTVLLLESTDAQPFDCASLAQDLLSIDQDNIHLHPPPWQHANLKDAPITTLRHLPTKYPLLSWSHPFPNAQEQSSGPTHKKLQPFETHDPILGALGILPKGIDKDILIAHDLSHKISNSQLKDIQTNNFNSSLKAFLRYEAHLKWKF